MNQLKTSRDFRGESNEYHLRAVVLKVMLINCALGLNTPPVGSVQFVGCAIGGISVGQVMRTIAPFYGALTVAMLLVTYVPQFTLWLPGLLM
jgi:TRAP-type C4-dicarboxylate transport system permease large subunit